MDLYLATNSQGFESWVEVPGFKLTHETLAPFENQALLSGLQMVKLQWGSKYWTIQFSSG
jgi:hypothetical protein